MSSIGTRTSPETQLRLPGGGVSLAQGYGGDGSGVTSAEAV